MPEGIPPRHFFLRWLCAAPAKEPLPEEPAIHPSVAMRSLRQCHPLGAWNAVLYQPRMNMHAYRPTPSAVKGFTLVEALVAISMTALAGSVLLLGTTSSLQSAEEAMRQTIALGLAQQLMDDVSGASSIQEVQDYNGLRNEPPVDRWKIPLGTEDGKGGQRHQNFRTPEGLLDHYVREVHVYPVAPSDFTANLTTGSTSDYRVVEVRVSYTPPGRAAREMACLRRVVTHVPPYEPID